MKSISENKLKAFSIGRMNLTKNALSKKEKEELKKREEEKKTAEVYNEFVAAFESDKGRGKTFIRGDVINPDDKIDGTKGKLYKPTSKLHDLVKNFQGSRSESSSPSQLKNTKPDKPSYKKKDDKKKSNLELFKEELKIIQAEREQRHSQKRERHAEKNTQVSTLPRESKQKPTRPSRFEPIPSPPREKDLAAVLMEEMVPGSHDNGDPMTTNLFLGNVNPNMDEQMLCGVFGKYGPLASVKIMWPRTDEERSRERNCAFVAFMTRKNAEKAMKHLQGKLILEYEMKLGWGKSVPIPPHPIYVPPMMLERTLPPPPSGLPFNAQPKDASKSSGEMGVVPPFQDHEEFEKTLTNSVVRVVIPTERNLLVIIHRMIEFVVREGPMFEAMIMNRELNNPMFRFLFENQSPAHIYYRWRMYSILQGETATKWRPQEFRLFEGGSLWRPPPLNPYEVGVSDSESSSDEVQKVTIPMVQSSTEKIKRAELGDEDRDKLEEILRGLLPNRQAVAEAMVFCLEHADAAEEIVECIAESLSILQTPVPKKIARIYLISDVLYNCSAKVANSSFFRKYFEAKLEEIMCDLHACHANIQGRLRAEQFKQRVMYCFRAWEDWAVYHEPFLIGLQNAFLGLHANDDDVDNKRKTLDSEDLEGGLLLSADVPDDKCDSDLLTDDQNRNVDLDGLPLDAAENVDGIPLEEVQPAPKQSSNGPRFVRSRWETVDPQDVEAQAMTTSKWDMLETKEEELDGVPLDECVGDEIPTKNPGGNMAFDPKAEEAKRAKLREIEVKVMKFQDDLESGRRERRPDISLSDQVERYREKLLEREKEKEREMGKERERKFREADRKREKKKTRSQTSDESSDSSSRSSPHRKRKRKNKDSVGAPSWKATPSLVAYDSGETTDSSRHHSSLRKKKSVHRSRSTSRDQRRDGSTSEQRRRSKSRSPSLGSKRSRSREDRRRKKRKNKH